MGNTASSTQSSGTGNSSNNSMSSWATDDFLQHPPADGNTQIWHPCRVLALVQRMSDKFIYKLQIEEPTMRDWDAWAEVSLSDLEHADIAAVDAVINKQGLPVAVLVNEHSWGVVRIGHIIVIEEAHLYHLRQLEFCLDGSTWPGFVRVPQTRTACAQVSRKAAVVLQTRSDKRKSNEGNVQTITAESIEPSIEKPVQLSMHKYWRTVDFGSAVQLKRKMKVLVWSWDGKTEIEATATAQELARVGDCRTLRLKVQLAPQIFIRLRGDLMLGMRHGRFMEENPGKLYRR